MADRPARPAYLFTSESAKAARAKVVAKPATAEQVLADEEHDLVSQAIRLQRIIRHPHSKPREIVEAARARAVVVARLSELKSPTKDAPAGPPSVWDMAREPEDAPPGAPGAPIASPPRPARRGMAPALDEGVTPPPNPADTQHETD